MIFNNCIIKCVVFNEKYHSTSFSKTKRYVWMKNSQNYEFTRNNINLHKQSAILQNHRCPLFHYEFQGVSRHVFRYPWVSKKKNGVSFASFFCVLHVFHLSCCVSPGTSNQVISLIWTLLPIAFSYQNLLCIFLLLSQSAWLNCNFYNSIQNF